MDFGSIFFFRPLSWRAYIKDPKNICEEFWDLKIDIFVFGKIPKINGWDTVIQYTQQ